MTKKETDTKLTQSRANGARHRIRTEHLSDDFIQLSYPLQWPNLGLLLYYETVCSSPYFTVQTTALRYSLVPSTLSSELGDLYTINQFATSLQGCAGCPSTNSGLHVPEIG